MPRVTHDGAMFLRRISVLPQFNAASMTSPTRGLITHINNYQRFKLNVWSWFPFRIKLIRSIRKFLEPLNSDEAMLFSNRLYF